MVTSLRASSVPALLLALVLVAAAARPDDAVDVAGSVVATAPRLQVELTLTNRGAVATGPLDIRGELFGEPLARRLSDGLEPGAQGRMTLDFLSTPPRPGLHALTLLLEHPVDGPPDGAGNPPMASQRAFLLLAVGATPREAVRIDAEPLRLDVRGSLRARLSSRDGERHRVGLRALTARGLRPGGEPIEIAVPAHGHATAEVPLVRAGAPRGTRQALLLVAESLDGPLARTSVAAVTVDVAPDPARLPGLRMPVLTAGLALVLLALGYEVGIRLRARRTPA